MILAITTLLFLVAAPFVWRRGPAGTGTAFLIAAIVAVATIFMAIVTGLTGVGKDWRVEAVFCSLTLTMAFIGLGIARAS